MSQGVRRCEHVMGTSRIQWYGKSRTWFRTELISHRFDGIMSTCSKIDAFADKDDKDTKHRPQMSPKRLILQQI